jgi:hypothetical protein
MRRFLIIAGVGVILAVVAPATAAAYWDYAGYLPTAGGQRAYTKYTNVATGNFQPVRMTWSSPFDRNFIRYYQGGQWETFNVYGPSVNYDAVIYWEVASQQDRFGCHYPNYYAGQGWTNCRATNPL